MSQISKGYFEIIGTENGNHNHWETPQSIISIAVESIKAVQDVDALEKMQEHIYSYDSCQKTCNMPDNVDLDWWKTN